MMVAEEEWERYSWIKGDCEICTDRDACSWTQRLIMAAIGDGAV